jgi:uncharacterized membrane protein HdeD (DUF308 family)
MTSTTAEPLTGLSSAGWIMMAAGAISMIAGVLAIVYPTSHCSSWRSAPA